MDHYNDISPEEEAAERRYMMERERHLREIDSRFDREDLNYMREMIKESDLPEFAKKNLFGLFSQSTILANHTDADIKIHQAHARIILNQIRIMIPRSRMNYETEVFLNNIEMTHNKMLSRGYHGFERDRQVTRISQVSYPGMEAGPERKPGLMRRLFGFGGGQ